MRRPALVALTVAFGVAAVSGIALGALKPLPLSARVIQRGELPGFGPFRPRGDTTLFKSAKQWVSAYRYINLTPAQASAQIARLHRERFTAVLVEQVGSLKPQRGGISWVMQLGSLGSARAELAASFREYKTEIVQHGDSFSPFSVSTIPGAQAYRVEGGGGVGVNILFADGPFLYLVGEGWSTGIKDPPARSTLIATVTKLYKRVHGHPPA